MSLRFSGFKKIELTNFCISIEKNNTKLEELQPIINNILK